MAFKATTLAVFTALILGGATAQARTLTVGTQCTNPPFNYRESSGAITGFDLDVANEVGKRIGAEIKATCLRFESLIPALLNNQFDLILASLAITDVRKKAIDFSIPYRSATGRFVGLKTIGINPFRDGKPDPTALKGKVIGVQRASTHDNFLQAMYPGLDLNRYDSTESMLLDLKAGRIDLLMTSPIKMKSDFLNKPEGKDYAFIGDEVISRQYLGEGIAIGMRKGNTELQGEINKALQSMFDDGTFKAINLKTWDFSVMPEVWK